MIGKNFKIWNIQIQGLFKDLLCFQGLSRAWNFSSKFKDFQGLLKDRMNPVLVCRRRAAYVFLMLDWKLSSKCLAVIGCF